MAPNARDFRDAGHLPHNRPDRQPGSPEELPRQRNGVTPQMHGRYPDYNVLDEADHWDEVTRRDGARARRAHAADPILHRTGSAYARRLLRLRDGAGS